MAFSVGIAIGGNVQYSKIESISELAEKCSMKSCIDAYFGNKDGFCEFLHSGWLDGRARRLIETAASAELVDDVGRVSESFKEQFCAFGEARLFETVLCACNGKLSRDASEFLIWILVFKSVLGLEEIAEMKEDRGQSCGWKYSLIDGKDVEKAIVTAATGLCRKCNVKKRSTDEVIEITSSEDGVFILDEYIPCYEEKLFCVPIRNRTEKPLLIRIGDTVISRMANADDTVYAVGTEKGFLGFTDDMKASARYLFKVSKGEILYFDIENGFGKFIPFAVNGYSSPTAGFSFESESMDGSIICVTENGELWGRGTEAPKLPNAERAVIADINVNGYCVVTTDGRVASNIVGVENALCKMRLTNVSCGVDSCIAIDTFRDAYLVAEGKCTHIAGFNNAVKGYSFGEHYILLRNNGDVKTDLERNFGKCRHVGISSLGYVAVNFDGDVIFAPFEGGTRRLARNIGSVHSFAFSEGRCFAVTSDAELHHFKF